MTLRWYGEGNDSVTLEQIRQIPGVAGVITALHDIPAGEAWTYEDGMKRKQEVEAKGLKLCGVESCGMICAADGADGAVKVLFADESLPCGAKVR